jgi:hypothetical protein
MFRTKDYSTEGSGEIAVAIKTAKLVFSTTHQMLKLTTL